MLIPGGMPFGVRLQTKGVMVVGLSEVVSGGKTYRPAYDGGVREKDLLVEINGKTVTTAEEASAAISAAGANSLTLTVLREGKRHDLRIIPKKCDKDGVFRTGIYLRDSVSGIGTVTFIEKEGGFFGGLGHGVCDSDTGALVPLLSGKVLPVRITGIEQGRSGEPGGLRGAFCAGRLGVLVTNSECGVFGVLSNPPAAAREAIPVCPSAEVKEGAATVLCTLGDDGVKEYTVEISSINRGARPTKSFTVRVTDPALLARTGGIVQGMSGSPIIQNGRLIGAVTHVLVDDPTTGYGIFIENMLAAADFSVKRAA
jgi:stage IV sporulation protein B